MMDWIRQIRPRPMNIPSGTFRLAFFTFFEIGIAYSAPMKSQNATAVIEMTFFGVTFMTAG